MTEEELIAEIERIKKHIKNTNSFFMQRDLRKYLKILKRQLKGVLKDDDQGDKDG